MHTHGKQSGQIVNRRIQHLKPVGAPFLSFLGHLCGRNSVFTA